MKNLLLGFTLLVLALPSCKKEDTAPPDSNAQGEYFNCKINGKYWTYKEANSTSRKTLTFTSYFNDAGYEISGDNVVDFPQTVVSFRITGVGFPDRDTVELTSYIKGAVAQVNNPPPAELSGVEFYSDTLHTGRIIFTTRMPKRLEGTFQVDVYRSELNRVVRFNRRSLFHYSLETYPFLAVQDRRVGFYLLDPCWERLSGTI